jgi:hypothetical protein
MAPSGAPEKKDKGFSQRPVGGVVDFFERGAGTVRLSIFRCQENQGGSGARP